MEELRPIGKKPIIELTVDELALLIYQNIAMNYAIPMALRLLKKDVLVHGNEMSMFLLEEVLLSDREYWKANPNDWNEINALIEMHQEKILKHRSKGIMRMEMEYAMHDFKALLHDS